MSFMSSNHESIGTAFSGWNIYEAGELSMIIILLSGRPIRPRS